jgi:hypothetical protein
LFVVDSAKAVGGRTKHEPDGERMFWLLWPVLLRFRGSKKQKKTQTVERGRRSVREI